MARQQTSIGLRYSAGSDVGRTSTANVDSAYASRRLLAVADGTAGWRTGEDYAWRGRRGPFQDCARVSATAIDALRSSDTDVPDADLLSALENAIQRAGEAIYQLGTPRMGTTLTAMLWSGNVVAVAHIGDSRGYLLRAGKLFQITHDHTVVQSLVDERRVTPAEAAVHPKRWQVANALTGRGEVEPDLSLREALLGDRYLLCSKGLSSVLHAETLHHTLTTITDPDEAVRRLVDLALEDGGPDSVTCVLADVVEFAHPPLPDTPILAGSVLDVARSPRPPTPTRRLSPEYYESQPAGWEADFTLDGYEVFESLGSGGTATVYRGRRTALGRDVAIKVVDRRIADARDLRRFRREVDATVRLSEHPNVVTLYDADTLPDHRPYLVMELCPGGSLTDRLRRDGPMDPAQVREVGIQVADAVAAAHDNGVLHRDIKPANLLVTRFGRVALADFGIAALPVPGQDMSVTLAMTPVYAAPEVFDGSDPSPAGDIYSLGATLYALLAGRAPRSPDRDLSSAALIAHLLRIRNSPIPAIPGVPTVLMAVLSTALEDSPAARHRTVADFRDALTATHL
ncbi:protein kinase [Actinoallomurus sp. NPDC050550]|uniref:bifunctional protein-serine/threonine kinase/phosphatase n=1 Tax=Actinoallomurus sp. NPDC050550 TaxID=3154937 RepID=UPI0033D810FD